MDMAPPSASSGPPGAPAEGLSRSTGGDAAGTIPPDDEATLAVPRPLAAQGAPTLGPAPDLTRHALGVRPEPGTVIGHFEVLSVLGQGGMGVVCLARDLAVQRRVALKLLPAGAGAGRVARFKREADAVASLKHPGILPVLGWGHDQAADACWLAMPLVEGMSYDKAAARIEPVERAVGVVLEAARALAYAHERGVVHRDVKPSNVMLEGERVFVVDFGLAKQTGADDLTLEGQVLGTPHFMAPEQALGSPAGPAADVYGLGATLFWALTREHPYDAPALVNLQLRFSRGDLPRSPRALRPDVPRDLEAVVLRCLEVEPGARYPTAAGLADELERVLRGEPVRARAPGALRRARAWLRARRGPALAAGALGLGVVASLASWGAASTSTRDRETLALSDAAIGALDRGERPWAELTRAAIPADGAVVRAARELAALEASPECRAASAEVRARVHADAAAVASLLGARCALAREELAASVERWAFARTVSPPDEDAFRARATAARAVAEGATALGLAAQAAEPVRYARDLLALLEHGHVRRRLPPPGPARRWLDGVALEGEAVLAPAWGVVRASERLVVPGARAYGPDELLAADALPVPRTRLEDRRGRFDGLLVVEAPRVPPFLIEAREVTRAQGRAFAAAGGYTDERWWADDPAGLEWWHAQAGSAQARAETADAELPWTEVTLHEARAYARWRGRRLPRPDEWLVAAGLPPWRAPPDPAAGGGADPAPRPTGDPALDASPFGALGMAGNVREWVLAPPEGAGERWRGLVAGGEARAPGLELELGRMAPRADRPRADLGFRCAADLPGGEDDR